MEKTILTGRRTIDGAGVRLTRMFANEQADLTDPFLLLDVFGSDDPKEYMKGFPWHPHRGIETVTYMLQGEVDHEDSLGNKGSIKAGDLQWMSAGSGIVHQEMPKQTEEPLSGFQLWVNLPADRKMSAPRYLGIDADAVPVVKSAGATVKVIAGSFKGTKGPVKDLNVDVEYYDIALHKGTRFAHALKPGYTTFCCVIEGDAAFLGTPLSKGQLLLVKDAPRLEIDAAHAVRFLLVSGKPLREPIAWGGPIVMNTEAELALAFRELDAGTFIKAKPKGPL